MDHLVGAAAPEAPRLRPARAFYTEEHQRGERSCDARALGGRRLLARSRGWRMSTLSLLLGDKQTFAEWPEKDAHDPKPTFGPSRPGMLMANVNRGWFGSPYLDNGVAVSLTWGFDDSPAASRSPFR